MLGAIIGDVAGSLYEFSSPKTKKFPFFKSGCRLTDDSMMTVAIGCACVEADLTDEADFKDQCCRWMRRIGQEFPDAGYGELFWHWLHGGITNAYRSFGNGSAMRVSPVAWAAESLEQAEQLAAWSAEVTHNHPEGIRGAQAVAAAIYLARDGKSKEEIKAYIEDKYYDLDFTLDAIRPGYKFNVTCQGSVPQAIVCFLEATDFEDAVRNAISLGGDCDTQGAMAGAIAEAFYGIPEKLAEQVLEFFPEEISDYYEHILSSADWA